MLKKFLLLSLVIFVANVASAQTLDELKTDFGTKSSQLADLQGKVGALQGEVDALNTKIKNLSGWDTGALGTIGANFSNFSNWGPANQNTFATVLGAAGNAFANLQNEKFFWRNGLNIVVQETKLNTNTASDEEFDFETTADAFTINSLYGYKLNSKWAISGLGEYRTTFLNAFNNPGFLDLGVGATWTPIPNAVVVIHPLNYNFIFADNDVQYESSLGAKIVADYSRALPSGIAWKTNLSAFLSYQDTNFSNWVWTNGLSLTVWKGIGVGFDFGFAGNRQLSFNNGIAAANAFNADPDNIAQGITTPVPDDLDNDDGFTRPTQSFWVLGLTYKL